MAPKYAKPPKPDIENRTWPDKIIDTTPAWCAVDLRDGNQALPNPLTPIQKKRYFQLLVDLGFKEIEIGFPSASSDDFQFCRDLIEEQLIPQDVTISVLTPARKELIERTFEALDGAEKAVCHLYLASSKLHAQFVLKKSPDDILKAAREGTRIIRDCAGKLPDDTRIDLEFSPEEFTDTDLGFSLQVCETVMEEWEPTTERKVILNLPATVERRPPNEYADMIELFCRKMKNRDKAIISVHSHNDMGCAIAATEMTLMAGAERVEGTLFGQGERSGNVDLATVALNLQYLGVDTGLRFDNIEKVRDEIEELTSMPVHPRHPYAGELVFTAFSGSHQDAIHKGLSNRQELEKEFGAWKIPYLHIDPADIGRSCDRFIRINSQSGKGGISHVLEAEYGIRLPRPVLVDFTKKVQSLADESARELESTEVWEQFRETYMKLDGTVSDVKYWPRPDPHDPGQIEGETHLTYEGEQYQLHAVSQGPISAFVKTLKQLPLPKFQLEYYEEDAIGTSAEAEAVSYVRLDDDADNYAYGVGFGPNIDQAAVRAITSALNLLLQKRA